MNKNGFTLVELLATIVILGVVMLIGTVSITGVKNKINENNFKTKLELIISNAERWGQDNKETLSTAQTKEVKDLIDLNYIEPDTGSVITNDINGKSLNTLSIKVYLNYNRVYACIKKTTTNKNLLGDNSSYSKYAAYYCS